MFIDIRHMLATWFKVHFFKKNTVFQLFFKVDGKFYEQCDSVSMSSPVRPTLPNDNN